MTDVETGGSGFNSDKTSKMLYEAQVFGSLTHHKWDFSHPNVSSRAWDRALYGAAGAHQYARLAEAMKLDETAALEACSWGMFQILGLNHLRCGYPTVQAYVEAMVASEANQVAAFVKFIQAAHLDVYLKRHDWVRFALAYNGPGERANGYDVKLAAAYARRSRVLPRFVAAPGHADAPETIGMAA